MVYLHLCSLPVYSMGWYVSGLYLEGAAWDHDTGKLRKQAPRQTVDELPVLQVGWSSIL